MDVQHSRVIPYVLVVHESFGHALVEIQGHNRVVVVNSVIFSRCTVLVVLYSIATSIYIRLFEIETARVIVICEEPIGTDRTDVTLIIPLRVGRRAALQPDAVQGRVRRLRHAAQISVAVIPSNATRPITATRPSQRLQQTQALGVRAQIDPSPPSHVRRHSLAVGGKDIALGQFVSLVDRHSCADFELYPLCRSVSAFSFLLGLGLRRSITTFSRILPQGPGHVARSSPTFTIHHETLRCTSHARVLDAVVQNQFRQLHVVHDGIQVHVLRHPQKVPPFLVRKLPQVFGHELKIITIQYSLSERPPVSCLSCLAGRTACEWRTSRSARRGALET